MGASNESFSEELLLPIIDLSPIFENKEESEKLKCGSEIYSAFKDFGGCYISGFNGRFKTLFPKEANKLSDIHKSCKDLFSLPVESKKEIPVILPGGFTRGYIPPGGESGSYKFEKKEAFSYGQERNIAKNPAENPLQGANSWPPEEIVQNKLEKSWKENLVDFYEEICDISEAVVKGMSLSLGYEENYLGEFCRESRSISLMRLFHYLGLNEEEMGKGESEIIGSSEHTDWGFLTLILQPMSTDEDTSKGLQFFHEGIWRDIPAIPETLVLNCGDYVSLFTNGLFKSPVHRVMSSDADRISMVFFLYPSFDSKIPRLDSLDNINGVPKLSLFANQKQGELESKGESSETIDILKTSFGSYILSKWDQVFRA